MWLPIFVSMPAEAARRRIIVQAFAWGRGVVVSSSCASADRPNQRPLRIAREPTSVDIGLKVSLEIVVAGHFVAFAAMGLART